MRLLIPPREVSGFTLPELVMTIALIGILTAIGGSKFFELDAFRARATGDEVLALMRYGRVVAVASGCEVEIRDNGANRLALWQRSSCAAGSFDFPVRDPRNSEQFQVELPASMTYSVTPSSTILDALGRASGDLLVQVADRSFKLYGETGYVSQ